MENCYNQCDDDEICKIWYAYEYDYDKEEWLWDIQECEKDFEDYADDVEGTLEDTADFIGDNFEGTLGMLQDLVCPGGACVNQSASMAANATAMVLENSVPEVSFQNISGFNVTEAVNMFYQDEQAVNFTN